MDRGPSVAVLGQTDVDITCILGKPIAQSGCLYFCALPTPSTAFQCVPSSTSSIAVFSIDHSLKVLTSTTTMSQFSVFQQQTKRESGKKAQHGNIAAAKVRSTRKERSTAASSCVHVNTPIMLQAVADIIRSTLGPRSMLKMLLDPNGGMTTWYRCVHRKAPPRPEQSA